MISGQSSRRSRSSRRRFVRKRLTFEGPEVAVEVVVIGGFKFSAGGTLKLLDLAREEVVVEKDILWEAD